MSAELQTWRSAGVARETAPSPTGVARVPDAEGAAAWLSQQAAASVAAVAPASTTRGPDRQTGRQTGQKALRWAAGTVAAALAFVAVPQWATDYWLSAILIPFLVLSLAGLGLNLLTGYAGQLSVGSAAFMAVGAFATYNFALRVPGLPLLGPSRWAAAWPRCWGRSSACRRCASAASISSSPRWPRSSSSSGCWSSSAGCPTTVPRA